MGYMEKRRHHKNQTTCGIISFLLLTFFSLVPFSADDNRLVDLAGEFRLYYIIISFILFLYFLYNKRWLFSFLMTLIIVSNIAFIYSFAARPFNKTQTELDGEFFSLLLYSPDKKQVDFSDLAKIIADKNPNAVAIFGIKADSTALKEIADKFTYHKVISSAKGQATALLSNLEVITGGDLGNKDGKLGLWSTFNISNRPITLLTSEVSYPWNSQKSYSKASSHISSLAEFVKSRDEPVILTGVFKAASWSSLLRPLQNTAELHPQEGIEPSYPSYLPWFLRFSFYHVYSHLGINIEDVEKISDSSSNAIPLLVKVKVLKERIE